MKPTPATALEVIQPELVLQLLVVALDPPSQLGEAHELLDRGGFVERRQPVLRRLGFAHGPLDAQPLDGAGSRTVVVAMSRPHPQPCEPRPHRSAGAFPPGHRSPGPRRHGLRERSSARRSMGGATANAMRWTSTTRPPLRLQRLVTGWPHARLARDPHDVRDLGFAQAIPKRRDLPVAGVSDHGRWRQLVKA